MAMGVSTPGQGGAVEAPSYGRKEKKQKMASGTMNSPQQGKAASTTAKGGPVAAPLAGTVKQALSGSPASTTNRKPSVSSTHSEAQSKLPKGLGQGEPIKTLNVGGRLSC